MLNIATDYFGQMPWAQGCLCTVSSKSSQIKTGPEIEAFRRASRINSNNSLRMKFWASSRPISPSSGQQAADFHATIVARILVFKSLQSCQERDGTRET